VVNFRGIENVSLIEFFKVSLQEGFIVSSENASAHPSSRQAIFLLLLTALVYIQTLGFAFMGFDDTPYILENPKVHTWKALPAYFLWSFGGQAFKDTAHTIPNLYRPAVATWVLLNYKLFGAHAFPWRLAVLVLYLISVWLFWRLAWRLTGNDFVSISAALLFALHPLHAEGIAWLSGSTVEQLLCLFFLSGFLSYLRWRDDPQPARLLLCGMLVLAALFSKETGMALPVLILIHAVLFRPKNGPFPFRRFASLAVAVIAPVFIYLLLRILNVHGVVVSSAPASRWADAWHTTPLLFVSYLKNALWPLRLANWYDVPIVTSISQWQFYLPFVVCLAYLGITVWAAVRKPLVGFLLFWWAVPLLPSFLGMLAFGDAEIMHDRFTFVALGGLCLLAAQILNRLPESGEPIFGFQPAAVAATLLLAISLGALTVRQAYTWKDDMSMAFRAFVVSPQVVRPRILLGAELVKRGRKSEAVDLYLDTLHIDPDRWESIFAYGTALASNGEAEKGIRVLLHGTQVAPTRTAFYLALAEIFKYHGRVDEAARILEQGIPVADQPELLRARLAQMQPPQMQPQRSAITP